MMLIIYGSLEMGGIETFFLRLSEERFRKNQKTKILLTHYKINTESEIYIKIIKYAEIIHFDSHFNVRQTLLKRLPLLNNLESAKISELLREVDHVHVTCPEHVVLAVHMAKKIERQIKITVGFYSHLEFVWPNKVLKYHSNLERKLTFEVLPNTNIFAFSRTSSIEAIKNLDLADASFCTFPIGVTSSSTKAKQYKKLKTLKICSVGRLVRFKTYNYWMIDVVSQLKKANYDVEYHIYGEGEEEDGVKEKIKELCLGGVVVLKGTLPYSKFNDVVGEYDLFVGSGTSITQASSLGVISIAASDLSDGPKSYGYFSDVYSIDWNIAGIQKTYCVHKLITDIFDMSAHELSEISSRHVKAGNYFSIEVCSENFNQKGAFVSLDKVEFSRLYYEISRSLYWILRKSFPRLFKFKAF